ncbi:hypothetical protein EVAR_7044_1 [Eumeta japonica]|uniref:Uncharacterized protein n=1 Tax=Eumeta variegata TaxID=151549 RepID=A0A4C1YPT2_EUMVA|nr:hypothetical protein EVAR_7044_1 [Eumeta japonica]
MIDGSSLAVSRRGQSTRPFPTASSSIVDSRQRFTRDEEIVVLGDALCPNLVIALDVSFCRETLKAGSEQFKFDAGARAPGAKDDREAALEAWIRKNDHGPDLLACASSAIVGGRRPRRNSRAAPAPTAARPDRGVSV